MSRILLYYSYERHKDRWVKGDRHIRRHIRRFVRGPDPVGGIDLVFLNLAAGLDRLGVEYQVNLPFSEVRPGDRVGVIGRDRPSLAGYDKENPILAGVAVTQHPDEWPTLFDDYPIGQYVVHSDWVADMFRRVYGDRVSTWAVGIDTEFWRPAPAAEKTVDFLIYDKIRWSHDRIYAAMVEPMRAMLVDRNLTSETIRYGQYRPNDLVGAFSRARAVLFLCEHETQGLAYQQAMAAGLPILAWDPGIWLDPWRFHYTDCTAIPAQTVPFFDERCGLTFKALGDFEARLIEFRTRLDEGAYNPRAYVEETLTLDRCAQNYVDLLERFT